MRRRPFIQKLFIALVVMALLIVVIGMLLPDRFLIERSIIVAAPAERVFEPIADLRQWPTWTTWNTTNYPSMTWTYDGASIGVGASARWTDPSMGGEGRMTVTDHQPDRVMSYEWTWAGGKQRSTGSLTLEPTEQGTRVKWSVQGDLSNIGQRYGYHVFQFAQTLGAQFDDSLEGLKRQVEGR